MRLFLIGDEKSYVPFGPAELAAIRQAFPDVEVERDPARADEPVDAVLAWGMDVALTTRIARSQPGLGWIHTGMAGVPAPLLDALKGHAVQLTNGSGIHGAPIAEWVVGAILAHYKRLFEMCEAKQRKHWARELRVTELAGRTVGIIGLGDIGLSTANLLRPFGVRLHGMRRTTAEVPGFDRVFPRGELHAFLQALDVLVLAAPLTPETRGLVGAAELDRLPAGAFLVNVARGALVDEAAMIERLRGGHLGGAALDVFETEPLPESSPLWELENVIISPHSCDRTDRGAERALELFVDNFTRFRNGEPLRNVVDRDLGY